jgi:hypothetical protein
VCGPFVAAFWRISRLPLALTTLALDSVLELPAVRVFTLQDDAKTFLEEGSLRVIVSEFEGKEVHILHVKEFKLSLVSELVSCIRRSS